MTRLEQKQRGIKVTQNVDDCEQDSDSLHTRSLDTNEIAAMDPSNSSASNNSEIVGNPPHHGMAWYVRAQNNVCKFCDQQGHFSKYCDSPHFICQKSFETHCCVNPRHISYSYSFKKCPFQGQTNAKLAVRGVPMVVKYTVPAGDFEPEVAGPSGVAHNE